MNVVKDSCLLCASISGSVSGKRCEVRGDARGAGQRDCHQPSGGEKQGVRHRRQNKEEEAGKWNSLRFAQTSPAAKEIQKENYTDILIIQMVYKFGVHKKHNSRLMYENRRSLVPS